MSDAYNAGRAAGIREAAEVAKMSLWKHGGDDAYSAGMDAGARHQNAQDVSAILALLDAPAPAGVTVPDELYEAAKRDAEEAEAYAAELEAKLAKALLLGDHMANVLEHGLVGFRGHRAWGCFRSELKGEKDE